MWYTSKRVSGKMNRRNKNNSQEDEVDCEIEAGFWIAVTFVYILDSGEHDE